MIKITRIDAYAGLDEMDMKVIDQELDSLFQSKERLGRDMTIQYFLEDKKNIVLKVYWDEEEVALYRFKNKGKLN